MNRNLFFISMLACLSLLGLFAALNSTPSLQANSPSAKKPSLSSLTKRLERAIDFRSEKQIKDTFKELGKLDSSGAAKVIIITTCKYRDLKLKDTAVAALISMKSKAAKKYLYKQVKSNKSWLVRCFLYSVLPKMEGEDAVEAFDAAIKSEKSARVFTYAVDELSEVKKPWAIDLMITLLEKFEKNPAGKTHATYLIEALQIATGKGIEAGADWKNWWAASKAKFEFPKNDGKETEKGTTSVIQRIKKRKEDHYLKEIAEGDIIVVEGKFDQVQNVLKELGIPYELVDRAEIQDLSLRKNTVLIFNCHDTQENIIPGKTLQKIAKFVENGGYLFTSDWELQNVLQKGFKGRIGMSTLTQEKDLNVKIEPSQENFDHPFLRDVFPKDPFKLQNYRWKIDSASSTLRFSPKSKVYPLVVSKELGQKYSNPTVAATFRHGRGSVLHVLSHFYQQRDAAGDGFALQQILANFIIERQKWRKKELEKKKKK